MSLLDGIPRLDVSLDGDQLQAESQKVLATLRPAWNLNSIRYMNFTEGISNKLIGCYEAADVDKSDAIVIRVYGEKTDLIINRNSEMLNMVLLHREGCGGELYCLFKNGIAYEFVPGTCLDEKSVRDPIISRLIIEEILRMQAIRPPSDVDMSTEPCLFTKLRSFLNTSPDYFPDQKKQQIYEKNVRCKTELIQEAEMLQRELSDVTDSPSVFCHNDLLLKNIVYNTSKERTTFIDFEYGAFNYEAYEIANHFCEYAGVDVVDYALYPDKDYQMEWLRTFLELRNKRDGKPTEPVTDAQVEKLYVQTNKFALVANFFWAVWALIQARYSLIDFDYLDYALIRFGEYYRRKEQFLALKVPS